MAQCKARGCKNNKRRNPEKHYFCIPKPTTEEKKHRVQQWLKNLGRGHSIDSFKFGTNSVVCSDHFEKRFIKRDLKAELLGLPVTYRLTDDAVPTIIIQSKDKRRASSRVQRRDKGQKRMATLQEEANHSPLSNSVHKTKNVAKKSTTKFSHSRGSSRSGSPCSMPSSHSHSRESSPEVRASILNGKLKVYASSQEESRPANNGPSSLAKSGTEDELVGSNPVNHVQTDQQLKNSTPRCNSDTAAVSSNGNTADDNTVKVSESMRTDAVCLEDSSSMSTTTVVTDTHITMRNEREVASCTLMSKPKFIQAKDVLRERLKAAVYKFSSEKSLLNSDKCSDGESSPTSGNKTDQSTTPNRCTSPVTPRSSMIDKGNLFEIMTLDLGKSSRESVATPGANEEPKSTSLSGEKTTEGSTANAESANSAEDGSTLPATPGVTTENNQTKQPVVQDVNKKSDTEQKQVVPENKSDREEEMLLLGVSDSNENFDTLDDSILDEEPKKDSNAKSELQKGVSEHQSNAGSSGGVHRSEESGSNVSDGVPERGSCSSDDMVVKDSHSPCEAMECSSSEVVSTDVSKSQEECSDLCSNESNKRKLSNNLEADDLQVKRGRVDSVESNRTVTDERSLNGEIGENKDGFIKQDTNSDAKQSSSGDVRPSPNGDVKSNTDVDIRPIADSDIKPDLDVKEPLVQCNGDKNSHPGDGGVADDDDDDVDDAMSATTVGCSSVELERTAEGEVPAVKVESTVKTEPDGIVKISRQALEKLIAKTLKEKLASSETTKQITDLQSRVDKLTEQLYRCKATAKSYQVKLADITKTGRPDRRRSLRGPVRHVGVQVDIVKQQASHMTTTQKGSTRSQSAAHQTAGSQPAASQPAAAHAGSAAGVTLTQATPTAQMASFASPPPPTIAPKVSGVGQPPAAAGQTFLVPVAGASANGTMTLIGPPGGANLASSQYRFTTVQASPKPTGVTVREMLDNKQTVTQVNVAGSGSQPESGVQEKVIDLTEDEENNPNKSTLTPITLAPGQVIVQSPLTSKSNGNIPTGTYLVPVTSGQPIILQSVVQQQLQQPLLLSSARPGVSQQQMATAAGQQLVNLVPAQAGVRPLLVQTPATTQAVSATKPVATTQLVSKSVPAPHSATATKPLTSKQLKHPAPLPPQPTTSKIGAEYKNLPPKPKLTISRVPQGIVLSWNLSLTDSHAAVSNYQLYAYQEGTSPPVSSLWKRVGDVKALPLPMACTLTQFHEGNKYYFAVRGVDEHGRVGPFSDPNSIHLDTASTS